MGNRLVVVTVLLGRRQKKKTEIYRESPDREIPELGCEFFSSFLVEGRVSRDPWKTWKTPDTSILQKPKSTWDGKRPLG